MTDLGARPSRTSVLEVPFAGDSFDLVISAWVVETVTDPRLAVAELLRVLDQGGRLVHAFCSLPHGEAARARSALLRATVNRGFAGEFLNDEQTAWRDRPVSHRQRFRGGLITEIALGKCRSVGAAVLPATAVATSASRGAA